MSYVQGQRSVCPKPRIPFFWSTSMGVHKRPILFEVLAPAFFMLQGSHVRSSTGNGLLYAAKTVP
jgi:hypothetical protein